MLLLCIPSFFFFNDTATTEIYTLSLHDALPIWARPTHVRPPILRCISRVPTLGSRGRRASRSDRKSTRLNSSHSQISYAVFCLKKKNATPHAPVIHHTPVYDQVDPQHTHVSLLL